MTTQTFHDFCKQQIARLAGNPGFPREYPEAVRELIQTLEFRVSKGSREFARRVVDTVLENSRFSPAPADLISIGSELREREVSDRRREDGTIVSAQGFAGCEACNYSGWVSVERHGYDYAAPCECRGRLSQ